MCVAWGVGGVEVQCALDLAGVHAPALIAITPGEILEYLKYVQEHGAEARIPRDATRVRFRPHSSYLEHQEEGMQERWCPAGLCLSFPRQGSRISYYKRQTS